jgi:large subunit ribosomal protein L17
MLSSLAASLLRHKRITTTVAKARETRVLTERIITRAKRALATEGANGDSAENRMKKFQLVAGHARREVRRMIRDKAVVAELFSTIAPKVSTRPGGYTRIVKLGLRQGDGAELAVIELVDFQAGEQGELKGGKKEKTSERPKKQKKAASSGVPAGSEKAVGE